jgi:hypothetical protein
MGESEAWYSIIRTFLLQDIVFLSQESLEEVNNQENSRTRRNARAVYVGLVVGVGRGGVQMHHIRWQQRHTQTRVETLVTHKSTRTQQTGPITVPDSEGKPLHTCDKRPGVGLITLNNVKHLQLIMLTFLYQP